MRRSTGVGWRHAFSRPADAEGTVHRTPAPCACHAEGLCVGPQRSARQHPSHAGRAALQGLCQVGDLVVAVSGDQVRSACPRPCCARPPAVSTLVTALLPARTRSLFALVLVCRE